MATYVEIKPTYVKGAKCPLCGKPMSDQDDDPAWMCNTDGCPVASVLILASGEMPITKER